MDLLHQLYFIHSPSRKEHAMSRFLRKYLKNINITDFSVLGNQIYRVKPNTKLMCAHIDQVQSEQSEILYYDKKLNAISSDCGIGADDKNGIYVILNMLKKFPDLSFIFSDQEECGGNVSAVLSLLETQDKNLFETIKYCLVFDRRNGSDILAHKQGYCEKDFDTDLERLGKEFGYKTTTGLYSDCDALSLYIPCANFSCGYYLSHTANEYTKLDELENSIKFCEKILSTLDKVYDRVPCNEDNSYTVMVNGKAKTRRFRWNWNRNNHWNNENLAHGYNSNSEYWYDNGYGYNK